MLVSCFTRSDDLEDVPKALDVLVLPPQLPLELLVL